MRGHRGQEVLDEVLGNEGVPEIELGYIGLRTGFSIHFGERTW